MTHEVTEPQPPAGPRACAYCGRPLERPSPAAKYCTAICRYKHREQKRLARARSTRPKGDG